MHTTSPPRHRASGPTALATLVATGRPSLGSAIADVLASQSLPATDTHPPLRAYSFVRYGRVPVLARDGRRTHLPARHVTLLRAGDPPHLGAFYGRVVVPEWGEDRLYGPCDDSNEIADALDQDHVSDLSRAKAPALGA